jgi:hypothetical protein
MIPISDYSKITAVEETTTPPEVSKLFSSINSELQVDVHKVLKFIKIENMSTRGVKTYKYLILVNKVNYSDIIQQKIKEIYKNAALVKIETNNVINKLCKKTTITNDNIAKLYTYLLEYYMLIPLDTSFKNYNRVIDYTLKWVIDTNNSSTQRNPVSIYIINLWVDGKNINTQYCGIEHRLCYSEIPYKFRRMNQTIPPLTMNSSQTIEQTLYDELLTNAYPFYKKVYDVTKTYNLYNKLQVVKQISDESRFLKTDMSNSTNELVAF